MAGYGEGLKIAVKKVKTAARRVAKKELLTEEEQLRDYELVLIISPEVAQEKLDAVSDSISQSITKRGGTVTEVERWGKRRLAYPIKHVLEGSYLLVRFRSRPSSSKELTAGLQISEEVLRYMLISLAAG